MSTNNTALPKTLTLNFDQISTPLFIREKESTRFIYANIALARLVGLRSPDAIIGRLDDEIPASLFDNEETAQTWQQQVRHVVSTQENLSLLEVHPKAVDCPYISRKVPFYNDTNECIGMVGFIRFLEIFSPHDFIRAKLPGSLQLSKPNSIFTEKESEIIFFRLQGMSSKEISQILCISPRTVEKNLSNMYNKAGVNNFGDFRYFCEDLNFHRYLPQRFLAHKRISFDYEEGINSNQQDYSQESNTSEHLVKEKDNE